MGKKFSVLLVERNGKIEMSIFLVEKEKEKCMNILLVEKGKCMNILLVEKGKCMKNSLGKWNAPQGLKISLVSLTM